MVASTGASLVSGPRPAGSSQRGHRRPATAVLGSVPRVPPSPQRPVIIRSAVGIGVYAAAFGATFGAVAVAAGLSRGQAQALSLVMFSGASQLALAGVVGAGGSAWTALGPTLLLA